jgi:multidrug efflux pump subunit AcrA (membrane-fusion protein)
MNTRRHWQLILGIAAILLLIGVSVTLVFGNGGTIKSIGLPPRVRVPLQSKTLVAASKWGGIVKEVHGRPGDRVAKGQVLIRLESSALVEQRKNLVAAIRITRTALESSKEMSAFPPALRSSVVEVHPEVSAAEDRYIRALAALDHAVGAAERSAAQAEWDQASAKRTEVRVRIGRSLASGEAFQDLSSMVPQLETRLRELDQILADSEVRAPETSVIDLLDLHAGDRLLPGNPSVVFALPGEYFCEFPIAVKDASALAIGLKSQGTFGPETFQWQVETLTLRTVPFAMREDRQVSQETMVRARIFLAKAVPGAMVTLDLPHAGIPK